MALLMGKASAGNDRIVGTSLDDDLAGYIGNDTLIGGAGSDYFYETLLTWQWASTSLFKTGLTYDFGRGSDLIDGGAGFDAVFYSGSTQAAVLRLGVGTVTRGTEVDTLVSIEGVALGDGNDIVFAGRGGYVVDCGGGNDRLYGIASNSEYYGGAGIDAIDLRNFNVGPVLVRLDQFSATAGAQNSIWIEGFENVAGSRTATNVLYGDVNDNTLSGGDLADTVYGGSGNDKIYGNDGFDLIDGQWGNDLLVGGSGGDSINGGMGADTIRGGDGNDTIDGSFDFDVIYGEDGDDVITDRQDGGIIYGGNGNDTIVSSGGFVHAGAGDDRITLLTSPTSDIYAGNGNDTVTAGGWSGGAIYGGYGVDQFIFTGGGIDIGAATGNGTKTLVVGFETIVAANGTYLDFGVGIDGQTLDFRNAADSSVDIESDGNLLYLTRGNDLVNCYGSGNVIRMQGGYNNAYVYGEDNFIYSANDPAQIFIVASSGQIMTGSANDSVNVDLSGGPSSLVVVLGAGNDRADLSGSYGIVNLGDGDDVAVVTHAPSGGRLWGGAGADYFRFETITSGATTIMDFNVLEDQLDLWPVSALSDVTAISQIGADVELFFADPNSIDPSVGFRLTLSNMLVSDLSDAIFA